MYKLLLVDDEALVREAIKENMRWEELGFECVADCEDGAKALESIEELRPDILLTDICMPFVDGLELTRQVTMKYPNIKVVILTGHDDFDYAQQAIKLRACDFILKPITAAELGNVLKKLKIEMDEEFKRKRDFDLLKQQLNESLPLLRERFLERLTASRLTQQEIDERLDYFNLSLRGPYFIIVAVDVDDFLIDGSQPSVKSRELMRFAVYNIVQEVADREMGATVFRNRDEKVLAILSGQSPEQLQELAFHASEEIRRSISSYLPLTVSIGIGHCCPSLSTLQQASETALSALDYRFLLGNNEVISLSDMERRHRSAALPATDWDKELVSRLKTGSEQETDDLIERIFASYRDYFLTVDTCYIHIQRLVLSLIHTITELGGEPAEVFGSKVNPLVEVQRYATLDDIERWMKEQCRAAVGAVMSIREDFSTHQVIKAQEHIKQSFADQQLTLKKVCHHVSMSTSYFSTLFKTHTGKTFIEFLTQLRIEKAKELLKLTALKSYEIADQVGFSDPHYFSVTFKKFTGCTPTEYRQQKLM
ncbi:response regulator [Paenibacillus abyssi]|uniref:AraC family transcriptional regulator n=1 Tax=Paenibacillus abyssi TaxID=1340531 RepID=A0A917CZP8_9BACL|nr:response regulator [Paenibacillus abyssi]GGG05898.1 AraC family transcriptional regulator [Paenibacillus abyssi]